ncbi:TPA: GTP 3',8-cyclase MoaA [Vibrio vulnificus]|uniref:GTP 3',8-cyclase n=1 Tax=Vibrio vulnificus (strain CMCP6) TaxID=216895 RepID=MOAA_VIBVU|nr:GTP 3',8-cyclase MoaA [Vibrio vulnificus]Q8D894.2 RecName: Full=GTP 3',8-cyclase; AltName: Full=Molybdenum cofactor biosynthesis protein A [Vibrio vulnificus CMCP6]AAO11411.2 molybdenum cofactor biosynthesis protein A [Vibrio vulnificus CMCP6]QMV37562.1 GTP 3',8-cyclase MoaA [Vibrio vulnificus]HAS6028283.1 GTP 3',8-cyclase MoaA [Vibrio vulnificus]HAS6045695.1 GTP 3',8-cyclase MoaA [Vibrio vulnificus]HAS6047807.1 GTP 3',8-cyclase MoaA [Vibrio vulnificus]
MERCSVAQQFEDRFHRKFYYLRLSVTDVCNFKCTYCLPDGYQPSGQKNSSFLNLSEIRRVVKAFADCGTSKVRITGGEPSLRKDFTDIIHTVASTQGIKRVATTTNGYRMEKHIGEWKEAGLNQINVSVDSLDPRMFHQITGENKFHQVMSGIDRAFEVGFEQVKVNVVLMKDLNHNELPAFLHWIKHRPIQLRFIELMQTGEMDTLFQQHHVSGVAIRNHLIANGWLLKVKAANDGPAQVFVHPDYQGEIGLIMPYEKDFCASCNRLRVSAKGKLHLCLFGDRGVELRDLLQQDDQESDLIARIQSELQTKSVSHFLNEGQTGMTPHLASIGG